MRSMETIEVTMEPSPFVETHSAKSRWTPRPSLGKAGGVRLV